jgi:hypothetical protein
MDTREVKRCGDPEGLIIRFDATVRFSDDA